MRKIIILIILNYLSSGIANAQIPVILRATISEQEDTTGCNFVKELTRISYEAIINGKAKLWDSPAKETLIYPSSLQAIEKSTDTHFLSQEVVFIYETWTNTNHDLKSNTQGFLFSNKTSNGEEVAYGYVEYDDLQEACLRYRINTNANGNYNANLANYIYSKKYNYKILQFAGKVIDNASDSRKIKEEYISTNKFNATAFSATEIPQKMVVWSLDFASTLTGAKADSSRKLVYAITNYLSENEEQLFNLGGDKIQNILPRGKWKITRIQVSELWKKINDVVGYDPSGIIIYINDTPLNEIIYRDMLKFDLMVGDKNWIDYIKEKNFAFNIISVNNQEVVRTQSYIYQKALQTYEWNRITDFVKFY